MEDPKLSLTLMFPSGKTIKIFKNYDSNFWNSSRVPCGYINKINYLLGFRGKSAISKVQKHIFCRFKNGKKSIFAPEKNLKLHFW